MAESLGLAASVITVIELTSKLLRQCKQIIETTRDAPKDVTRVLVEVSSLKAALKSLQLLSSVDSESSGNNKQFDKAGGAVKGCEDAVAQLADELQGIALGSKSPPRKRQKIEGSLKWTFRESKVRKLLDDILQHKTTITLTLLGDVAQDVKEIKYDVRIAKETATAHDQREICDWLEHTNPSSDHNSAYALHEQDTCEWILQCDEWKRWLTRSPEKEPIRNVDRFLWIHGIPGSGKTVLASYIATQIEVYCTKISGPSERHPCLYYYCSFRHQQDDALPFLRWIASQLCRYLGRIPGIIADKHHLRTEVTISDLKTAIRILLEHVDVLYIVLDAVDESNPRNSLLSVICDLITGSDFANIRLIATSREYSEIETWLRPISLSLPMSNPIVDADVRKYVQVELQKNRKLRRWPDALKEEILEGLVKGSKGMFRWAVCQIDILRRKRTENEIQNALRELPETLDETYERILLEISREDWPVARTVLLWICAHSTLPFKFGISSDCLASAISHQASKGHCYDFDTLQDICGCLVRVAKENVGEEENTKLTAVSLAHYTVREYFYSDRISSSSVSFFSLNESVTVPEYLRTVYEVLETLDLSTKTWDYSQGLNFGNYCCLAVCFSSLAWGWYIVQDHGLRDLLFKLLLRHPFLIDIQSPVSTTAGLLGDFDDLLRFGPHFMRLFHESKVLSLPNDPNRAPSIWGDLHNRGMHNLASAFAHARNKLDMILHPVRLRVDINAGRTKPRFEWLVRNLFEYEMAGTFFDLTRNVDQRKFPAYLMVLHCHERACLRECVLDRLPSIEYAVTRPGVRLTPLQLAVHKWDIYAVRKLLDAGVNVNDVGDPNGEIIPYTDDSLSPCSPLHILRTAAYGLEYIEYHVQVKESRAANRAKIEQMLLCHGAQDFVEDRSEMSCEAASGMEDGGATANKLSTAYFSLGV